MTKHSILMASLSILVVLLISPMSMAATGISASSLTYQTVVTFSLTLNDVEKEIHIGLFDDEAPYCVNNFLNNYVSTGAYDNSFFHRSDSSNHVLQGGGFTYNAETQVYDIVHPRLPIPLEYGILNERGTIGMARSIEPNSATSQFYFNTADNSTNFAPKGDSLGYAVFGRVLGTDDGYAEDGMDIIDQLAAMTVYNRNDYLGGGSFQNLPLLSPDYTTGAIENYLLKINSATITVVGDAAMVIPEPATLSLLGLGALGLLKRKHA